MLLSVSAFAQFNEPLKGDVNDDGIVDVADITAVIGIIKNAQEHYFYLGTIKPTAENYKVIPGATTSFTSLDEAMGTSVSVNAGQTLYMLCPATWILGSDVTIVNSSGQNIAFSSEIDNSTVPGYSIYKTEPWSTSSEATLKQNIICSVELNWNVYSEFSNYINYGSYSDWTTEWIYGWDETDKMIFGELGYTTPASYNLRRYYTQATPNGPHTSVLSNSINGTSFFSVWDFGYWDILLWSKPASDGIQNLMFNETLESVTAYTNRSMWNDNYQQPEQLFAASVNAEKISETLEGFEYDPERSVWTKKLYCTLKPVTYIYLTQVILHNNSNKIIGVDGSATLSGMARATNLNTGVAGDEAVSVGYDVRYKRYMATPQGEQVDVIGGRVVTFGIPGLNGNKVRSASEVNDTERHYMSLNVQFSNGTEQSLTFDVTDQVRRRWKGGVITIDLDMDTIPMPRQ